MRKNTRKENGRKNKENNDINEDEERKLERAGKERK